MQINPCSVPDVFSVDTCRPGDQRGSFARFFCAGELAPLLGTRQIVQINHSHSREAGTVRGMHFQYPPHAEMKMVRCVRGKVFDVAVDLRQGSATFLHWHGETLSAENDKMLVIPEGFAHGFQTLTENTELLYLHTAAYAPQHESGVRFDDPALAIDWPLPFTVCSQRDKQHSLIKDGFSGIEL